MFYKIVIEVSKERLEALKCLLQKVEEQAKNKKIDEHIVLWLRLFPDMFPLIRQVQIATDNAKWSAARLAGKEIVKFEDTEKTFANLYARIDKTIALLNDFKEEDFADAATRKIELPYFKDMHFTGEGYLLHYHFPNMMFHITTAYAILRANGFNIWKADFMNKLPLIPNS